MATIHLSVPDVSCNHCARTIQQALGKLAGVHAVRVDVPAKQVTVDYDEAVTDVATVSAALDAAGYPVRAT